MLFKPLATSAIPLTFVLSTANAVDIAQRSTPLSDPATAGTFVNTGLCGAEPFVSGIVSRSLHGSSYVDFSAMTVESCAAYCSAYNYFAVEYGSECYCGNTFNSYTTQDTTGGCNFPCAGNPAETCGGSGRMNLYQQNVLTTTLNLPTSLSNIASQPNVTISGYSYYGCITEPYIYGYPGVRGLTGGETISQSMSIEMCASLCAGFNFFGVEYSEECWCGNTLDTRAGIDCPGSCNMGCTGVSSEVCGGSSHLGLYVASGVSVPVLATTATTCSATNTATSSANPTIITTSLGGSCAPQAATPTICSTGLTCSTNAGSTTCGAATTSSSIDTASIASASSASVASVSSASVASALAASASSASVASVASVASASSASVASVSSAFVASVSSASAASALSASIASASSASVASASSASVASASSASVASVSSAFAAASASSASAAASASRASAASASSASAAASASSASAAAASASNASAAAASASSASVASVSSAFAAASASSASAASASSASAASASSASAASASSASAASASSASVASASSASVASASSASVASVSSASAASVASVASMSSASVASASAASVSRASASSASVASASSASIASVSSASVASVASLASVSSASVASVSSASVASASSASVASASSASVASASSASVASASSASIASVASASSASVASASSASVVSASKAQASKTSGCTTATNTPAATNQLLVNPSFEWVDSTCTETIYPWYSSSGFVTYNTWQTQDGKWYASAFQNNAYIAQKINSTAYGTYTMSLWYRLPTAFTGSYGDSCTLYVTLDSATLFTTKLYYPMTIVGNQAMAQLTASGVGFTAANAGLFSIGWSCTNSAKISIDIDLVTMTKG